MTRSETLDIYKTIVNSMAKLQTKPTKNDLLLQMAMLNFTDECVGVCRFNLNFKEIQCEETQKEILEDLLQLINEGVVKSFKFTVKSGRKIYFTTECTSRKEVDNFLAELRKFVTIV